MDGLLKIAIISIVVCMTIAHPQQQSSADAQATLVSNTFADDGAGNFNFAFETSNGIKNEANGQLKDITVPVYDDNGQQTGETTGKGEVQQGRFSYPSPDGTVITVEWKADELGEFFKIIRIN
jgi:hypothetical protein